LTNPRQARGSPLSIEELDELIRVYRQTSADLAVARRDFPDDRVTGALNQLVTRAYGLVYRDPPNSLGRVRDFFWHELPREYRTAWRYLVVAAALLFVPFLATMAVVLVTPDSARLLLPGGLLDEIKGGNTWFDASIAERPLLASFIMTHNIGVSFLALGGGILAGVGTVAILIDNGVQLGAVSGALVAFGLGDRLVGFVGPHGFLELSVVVVAGACGLMLGQAVVWPRLQTRSDALAAAGTRSFRLLLGLLPFLALAGLIEGFVSPTHFAWSFKLAIGVTTAVGLYSYLLLAGRDRESRR
jgi:uncharacterized membrane protein SpoIIM required for sporulation